MHFLERENVVIFSNAYSCKEICVSLIKISLNVVPWGSSWQQEVPKCKMLLTVFSNKFPWLKMFKFWINIHLKMVLRVWLMIIPHPTFCITCHSHCNTVYMQLKKNYCHRLLFSCTYNPGRALYYYSDLILLQSFQPMAVQLSLKAALPLA